MDGNGISNGTPRPFLNGHLCGRRCDELLRELGEGATHGDVLERLKAEGGRLSYHCYVKHYRRMFGRLPPGHLPVEDRKRGSSPTEVLAVERAEVAGAALAGLTQPAPPREPTPPDRDNLERASAYLYFAGAVDRVGGVARARRLLDQLEQLGGIL